MVKQMLSLALLWATKWKALFYLINLKRDIVRSNEGNSNFCHVFYVSVEHRKLCVGCVFDVSSFVVVDDDDVAAAVAVVERIAPCVCIVLRECEKERDKVCECDGLIFSSTFSLSLSNQIHLKINNEPVDLSSILRH